MTLKSRALTILIILLMAGALAACGRKGALEAPPQSSLAIERAPLNT